MTAVVTGADRLSGPRKAAILCLALGTEASARILRQLSPQQVEQVSEEIARLPTVPADLLRQVVTEYQTAVRAPEPTAGGGLQTARELLEATLGLERARGAVERIATPPPSPGLSRLGRTTPAALVRALEGEHPQTLAAVLAHVEPRLAAGVVGALAPALAADVTYRMAHLKPVVPEVLAEVERALCERVALALATPAGMPGGAAAVARVLTMVPGPTSTAVLEALASRGEDLAVEIRDLMFVFEDLLLLDDRSMQRLLRDVASQELAMALKAASDPLRAKILKNMSERAAEALQEEMELLGAVKVKDVQAAHGAVVAIARELQESGEIVLDRGDGEDTVG